MAGISSRRRQLRRLRVELLEPRAMLAGDSGGLTPLVEFRLAAADPVTLEPLTQVEVGREFALLVYTRDVRTEPRGVFSAYLDVRFPAAVFRATGAIEHRGGFTNGPSGELFPGLLDEIGGFAASTRPPGGAEQLLASITMVADQPGTFTWEADPADQVIGHEVLVHGRDEIIPPSQVQFHPLALVVTPMGGGQGNTPAARIDLTVVNLAGQPVSSLLQGDEFYLQARVTDTRAAPQGLFSAYADVRYPADVVRTVGSLEHLGGYTNGVAGDLSEPGVIDEAGGFTSRLTPYGSASERLFQVRMRATQAGTASFRADPADLLTAHPVLLFGVNQAVDLSQVSFGEVRLDVRPVMTVVDDSFTVPASTSEMVLDVLRNDLAAGGPQSLQIESVSTTGVQGQVTVAADGRSLLYRRAGAFSGTEQFRYTAVSGAGRSTGQVTLQVQPRTPEETDPTDEDLVEIRLQATDLAGTPLSQVAAGEPFQIQAWVRDLRTTANPRGVFAAYLDLLYDASRAVAGTSLAHPQGVAWGDAFRNGPTANAIVPGLIDEVGAFRTTSDPGGSEEQLLFTARFVASAGQGNIDHAATLEDTPVEIDVLANDLANSGTFTVRADPADRTPESDVLVFGSEERVPPERIVYGETSVTIGGGLPGVTSVRPSNHGGQVTILSGGRVRYEPPANFAGRDEFSYSLGTGQETLVVIEVAAVPDAPRAAPDFYLAGHRQALEVSLPRGVLANDTDADHDPLQARLVSPTQHGTLTWNDEGSFRYVPAAAFFGVDRFTYVATDGGLDSSLTEVVIEVSPPPVQIRIDAVDLAGQPLVAVEANTPFLLRAFARDLRDDSRSDRGVGAVYFDLQYPAARLTPRTDGTNPLGLDARFTPEYLNARSGKVSQPGLIDDLGALQTSLSPLGRNEVLFLSVAFEGAGPQAAEDSYQVSTHSEVNVFDVLANEVGKVFPVTLQALPAGNSPHKDVVLYSPAQALLPEEVAYGSVTVPVRNSSSLTIHGWENSAAGGRVTLDSLGRGLRYAPPLHYVGPDSFTYTIRDAAGHLSSATVQIEVVDSWSNVHLKYDSNSDSFITPIDVLRIINDLNARGGRRLPDNHSGATFLDTNHDGFVSAIDALIVINYLSRVEEGAGEAAPESVYPLLAPRDQHADESLGTEDWLDELARDSVWHEWGGWEPR